VTDVGLSELSDALKHLNCLHCLHLNISRVSPKLTDNAVVKFCEALELMFFLNELSLIFEGYLLSQLPKIYLPLRCGTLKDKSLIHLSKALRKLPLVQRLTLNFQFWRLITNEGLNMLSEAISHLTKLKILDLNFHE